VNSQAVILVCALLWAAPAAAEQPAAAQAPAATPPASSADRAERARIADIIMAESGVAATLDQMIPAILDQLLPALADLNAGREAEIRAILSEEFGAAMKIASPAIITKSRDLYVERFTAAELNEMLAFNRSTTGRKAARLLPEIQLEMLTFGRQAGQAAVAAALPRIIDRLKAANLAVPATS
jgi:hypothetical protein